MKICMVVLAIVAMSGILNAQDAQGSLILHPGVSYSDLAASCFSDSFFARNYLGEGGEENNPPASPFVQTSIRMRFGLRLWRRLCS